MKKFVLALMLLVVATRAEAVERRLALVIGNANYQTGALPTPANDAGLVAQTLQAAGFDVTGARDLDQESLRRAFRDFLNKTSAAGPDAVAYVYLSGYGLQLEGENYFAPIDARIATDANVSAEALRLSDFLRPLDALHLKATIVVLDLARANPFAKSGNPLTSGLALVEPEQNTLIAFNAAPGTVAPNEAGPYSAFAQALAEISREGGVGLDEVFTRVRLRVNQLTAGAEVPWQSAKLEGPLYLFERAADAPPPAVTAEQTSSIRTKPIREFDAHEAYAAALERDTLQGYLDFVAAYPDDPMVARARAIIAARREAITWRRTRNVDTPRAYWSYLKRYPRGAHSYDARRRLHELAAAFEPPPTFEVIEYDVPPPPPDEIVYVDRPVLVFDDPDFDFAPPPEPSVIFLPPPPVYFIDLPPPPAPVVAFMLPMPEYRPVPVWVIAPREIAPPPANIIYNNIHNKVVINNTTNTVVITNPQGQSRTVTPAAALGPTAAPASVPGAVPAQSSRIGIAAAGVAALGAAAVLAPSLPVSIASKAATTPNPSLSPPARPLAPGRVLRVQSTAPPSTPNAGPANTPATTPLPSSRSGNRPSAAPNRGVVPAQQQPSRPQIGQPLPGTPGGQPLPSNAGRQSGAPPPRTDVPGASQPAPQFGKPAAIPPAATPTRPETPPSLTPHPEQQGRSPQVRPELKPNTNAPPPSPLPSVSAPPVQAPPAASPRREAPPPAAAKPAPPRPAGNSSRGAPTGCASHATDGASASCRPATSCGSSTCGSETCSASTCCNSPPLPRRLLHVPRHRRCKRLPPHRRGRRHRLRDPRLREGPPANVCCQMVSRARPDRKPSEGDFVISSRLRFGTVGMSLLFAPGARPNHQLKRFREAHDWRTETPSTSRAGSY